CALAVADYDRDGYPDLVLAGLGTNSVPLTRIYRNALLGAFAEVPAALPGVSSGCAAWGDFDNDGFPDLVITGTTNGFASGAITRVYHNNAGTSFTDLGGALPGVSGKAAAWGDYDNDGDLDLLLGARVFRNNFNAPNAPPSPPTALASTILRDGVRLSWATSTDAESMNPTMLTYNLRVGTEPGGIQIVAPQSDLDSGFRRVPQPGNCGNLNSWRFLNLAKGTYYWSVQAVDSVFAGSPFAAEGVSVVTNFPPPVAQSQSITTAEDQPREILLSGIAIDGDPLSFLVVDWPSFGRLTGIAPSLVYWPLTNYFGPDQFSFRVYDSQTNSLPATVFVTVTPLPDVVGPTLAIGHLQNAAVQLSLQLEPWQTYELQASEDLFSWFPLTNVLSTNSFLPWVDADYTNFNRRFYRLVSPR
ncbi:MAG TPA: FG-GAP-like repeat-containing protein, partial [Verrucomicrobiae bacterium]